MDTGNTLGYLLPHLGATLERQSDQVLQECLGIGMSQFKLLIILQHKSRPKQRDLAAALGQTEASISRQVKILQIKNILITKTNPANRRERRIALTAKGVRLTQAANEILLQHHRPLLDNLPPKQHQQLTALLCSLHEHICRQNRNFACRSLN